jgi:exonuclease III
MIITDDSTSDRYSKIIKYIKVETCNVGGISHKIELVLEFSNMKVDIVVITETKKKNERLKETGNYVMIYSGVSNEN